MNTQKVFDKKIIASKDLGKSDEKANCVIQGHLRCVKVERVFTYFNWHREVETRVRDQTLQIEVKNITQ